VRALWIGIGAGVVGILCCVSPVALFLFGISTATEAVTLGDRLYYGYNWYFAAPASCWPRQGRSCTSAGAAAAFWLEPLPTGERCWASV